MHPTPALINDKSNAAKVVMDQVRAMEGASVGSRLATISMGMIASWLTHTETNQNPLIVWQLCQIVLNLTAIWTTLQLRQVPLSAENVIGRLRRSTLIPTCNGLLWSVGIMLMWATGNLEQQLLVIFFIVGISTGSLYTLKAYLPALFLFFIPCVGSVVLATICFHYQNSLIIALATTVYIIWSSGYGITAHRELINAMYKHYETVDLANKLQEQIEIAEAATQAKSRFLAAASHDMRQPMHALNLYLGALANFDIPSTARPVLTMVKECAQTMDEMFSALLDISQLDASILQPSLRIFSITSVFNKVHLEFSQQALAKGLSLRVAPCSAMIFSDPELVENILRNLVSNAIRYTKSGKILIGCRRTDHSIRIGVYDTGIGIAPAQQTTIFEEFYQVANRERNRSQGLGLGLAIVQRQARLLQAPLSIRSEIGRGSQFEIELPRSLLASAPVSVEHEPQRDPHNLNGALIVIVDDETIILNAARLLLEQWGCSVITANSGPEALSILATATRVPDAIICDHRLRFDETGVQVIAAVRNEFCSDIPAVLITGDTSPEQFKTITAAGLPVLHKPLQSQTLQAMLLKLLARENSQGEQQLAG